jgi:hypothetical protein
VIGALRQALADALAVEVGAAAIVWPYEPDALEPAAVTVDYAGGRPADNGLVLDRHEFTVRLFAYASLTNPAAAAESDALADAVNRALRTMVLPDGVVEYDWSSTRNRRQIGGVDHDCLEFTVPITARTDC